MKTASIFEAHGGRFRARTAAGIGVAITITAFSQLAWSGETPDLNVVHQIKAEAFKNSKVMDHLFYLTDANGPRLTGSPGFDSAAAWAQKVLKDYGLENVHLEPWGTCPRSWTIAKFELAMTRPVYTALHGTPKAWCAGTAGAVRGPVIATSLLREDENARELDLATLRERIGEYQALWKGKLKGKIVLLGSPRDFEEPLQPESTRLDEKNLASMVKEPDLSPAPKPAWIPDTLPRNSKKREALFRNLPLEMSADYWKRRARAYEPLEKFLHDEGVLAVLQTDRRGAGGIVFSEAA
ncbi:MAG TPA: hypothetical protein VKY92_02540, partial [Verrucomicrobiae bacterium]|nr:hypothetical protein [Verrucomicrobiae bacterium]